MFGFNRSKIEALERQLGELARDKAATEAALAAARADSARLQAAIDACQSRERSTQQLFEHLKSYGNSLGETQQTLASLANKMKDEKQETIHAATLSAASRESIHRISTSLTQLADDSRNSVSQVDTLKHSAEKIGGIVNLIKEVADQTNLLALNAAIEAARAGESGRGFAVVADEVRKLAERTTKATAEISTLVAAIQKETVAAQSSMSKLATQSDQFGEEGANASARVDEITTVSKHMEQSIAASALRSFTELAKVDHLIFKFEIYKVFMNISEKRPEDFASHTGCRLGKWYYEGEGKACFSTLDGYRDMEAPHLEVHKHGRDAVAALAAGNFTRGVELVGVMEGASHKVLHCLERMAVHGEKSPDILCMDHP